MFNNFIGGGFKGADGFCGMFSNLDSFNSEIEGGGESCKSLHGLMGFFASDDGL